MLKQVLQYPGHVSSYSSLRMQLSSDERLLVCGGEDKRVRLWEVDTGRLLFVSAPLQAVPRCAARVSVASEDDCGWWMGGDDGVSVCRLWAT